MNNYDQYKLETPDNFDTNDQTDSNVPKGFDSWEHFNCYMEEKAEEEKYEYERDGE